LLPQIVNISTSQLQRFNLLNFSSALVNLAIAVQPSRKATARRAIAATHSQQLPPGPLPARRAYRPEGRPYWAGGNVPTSQCGWYSSNLVEIRRS